MKKLSGLVVLMGVAMFSASFAFANGQNESASTGGKIRVAMVVKNVGNTFFNAVQKGGEEAASQLKDIDLIYQGPSTPTVEGQISIVNSLIAQHVDAITITANDPNALVPVLKQARAAGIKVMSFDSGVAQDARILHLENSSDELVGRTEVQLLGEMLNYKGEIAILSSTAQATNQNSWISYMKKELQLPKYANMKLDAVVYGNDLSDKSYREALGLFKSYPNLKGIISPTAVGLPSTAKAIEDAGLTGKIQVTGLALPSDMKKYVLDGTCQKFELWNPVDLGYTATYLAYLLAKNNVSSVSPGQTFDVGRMGTLKVEQGNNVVMEKPFVFDKSNIDKYAAMF